MRSAVVVGGGIGGLSVAAGLHASGWTVTVLEQAPEFAEVGAGISLWPNAFRALEVLGIERPEGLGPDLGDLSGSLRDWRGRTIVRVAADPGSPRPVLVHRAALLDALLAAVPEELRRTGVRVREVRQAGGRAAVVHDGEELVADLVIGADGVNSVVRQSLWPDAGPVYAGQTVWRAVAPIPQVLRDAGAAAWAETWGPGGVVGMAPMQDDRFYLYATATVPAGQAHGDVGAEAAEFRARFRDWCTPIPEVFEAIESERLIRSDLYHLPPLSTYVDGRIALLGDAAHAMMPNLGQGGCQALEDAATLVRLLETEPGIEDALTYYDTLRRPRASKIAKQSLAMSRTAHLSSAAGRFVRDRILRLVPKGSRDRALVNTVAWSPPRRGDQRS